MRLWLAAVLLSIAVCTPAAARTGTASPLEGFAMANGVRLQYLDWGGAGPALILIHGLGDDPHVFEDLAPAFTDRFRVIAYARRGSGSSDVRGPYDNATLTDDLRGLMDALQISKAHLVGYSAGGNEVTEMAARHPERVRSVIYFDSAYDWSDPDYRSAFKVRPVFERPASASASFDAFRAYQKAFSYAGLDDMSRVEAYLRQKVVIQGDGSVRDRLPQDVKDALYAALFANGPRDYLRVRCPVLAIYPENWFPNDMADPEQRRQALAYDGHFAAFKAKSIERVRREIHNAEILSVPGSHGNFFLVSRPQVVSAMRRFLGAQADSR